MSRLVEPLSTALGLVGRGAAFGLVVVLATGCASQENPPVATDTTPVPDAKVDVTADAEGPKVDGESDARDGRSVDSTADVRGVEIGLDADDGDAGDGEVAVDSEVMPIGAALGQPCSANTDCQSGFCLAEPEAEWSCASSTTGTCMANYFGCWCRFDMPGEIYMLCIDPQ